MDYSKMKKIDKSLSVEDRIGFLRFCCELYENQGESPIEDFIYDAEYYELLELDPNNSFFDEVGGKLDEHVYGESIPHQIIMGSLNKSLNISDFEMFLNNTYSQSDNVQFLLQHKIDGLSISLLYKSGKLIQALTRGDGEKGISVFNNCKFIKDIPQSISCLEEVEIRGEIFKDKADFLKNWKNLGYANERNFASGSLNQKKSEETGRRGLSAVMYLVLRKNDFVYEQEKIDFLEKNGFKTLKSSTEITPKNATFKEIVKCVEAYMKNIDREALPYPIDGVVTKLCDIKKSDAMGTVSNGRKKRSDRAIKFPPSIAETTIIDIEVKTGRSGKLCPVGILKPVALDGSIMSRVTLHNFGMLIGKDALKIGATVRIAKKGDIIPQVVQIVENKGTPIKIPNKCPSCQEKVEWSESKADLICNNINCGGLLNGRLEYFVRTLGIDGIGPGIIERLTSEDAVYSIKNISDIYNLHNFKKELAEDFGDKASENILSSINLVTDVPLSKFIHSLGISKIGSMSKDIVKIAPTIEDIDKLTAEDVMKIRGFKDKKANSFINGWRSLRPEITKLLTHIKIKEKEMSKKSGSKLSGSSFCLTGAMSMPRKEIEAQIELAGGEACSGVKAGLTYLVQADPSSESSKSVKALKLGVKIISEDELWKMLK